MNQSVPVNLFTSNGIPITNVGITLLNAPNVTMDGVKISPAPDPANFDPSMPGTFTTGIDIVRSPNLTIKHSTIQVADVQNRADATAIGIQDFGGSSFSIDGSTVSAVAMVLRQPDFALAELAATATSVMIAPSMERLNENPQYAVLMTSNQFSAIAAAQTTGNVAVTAHSTTVAVTPASTLGPSDSNPITFFSVGNTIISTASAIAQGSGDANSRAIGVDLTATNVATGLSSDDTVVVTGDAASATANAAISQSAGFLAAGMNGGVVGLTVVDPTIKAKFNVMAPGGIATLTNDSTIESMAHDGTSTITVNNIQGQGNRMSDQKMPLNTFCAYSGCNAAL